MIFYHSVTQLQYFSNYICPVQLPWRSPIKTIIIWLTKKNKDLENSLNISRKFFMVESCYHKFTGNISEVTFLEKLHAFSGNLA